MYTKDHLRLDLNALGNAIDMINRGQAQKCEISNQVKVYKVPSRDATIYTIRIDIKEEL